ncbi:MAG TPA: hypothetical protein VE861_05230 [Gemmatimonadaceae bacterium]|nr:hypothetical protein [Gemmatimonadaceae bacterium]
MMQGLDITAIRSQATVIVTRILAYEQLDLVVVGSLLAVVIVLTLSAIWRNRVRGAAPQPKLSTASGFTRWLTPMGMQSIPAEPGAVVPRPRRKSGSQRTIKVSTPVSKVTARSLKAGSDPLEIARRSGLSRDAVVMMMANAAPKHAKHPTAASVAAAVKAPARTAASEQAMSAPGPYTAAQRAVPERTAKRGAVGSLFTARLG